MSLTSRIVRVFLTSKLSILLLIASLAAGAAALLVTPREEEPQIVVPMADVILRLPGASAEEVEKLVATPVEAKLWEIDGVEHVYSASRPGEAVVTVRFRVGEDRERSLVKVWNKLMSNSKSFPPGWTVKPVEIDDVPILLLTLSSPTQDSMQLRRVADELLDKLTRGEDTGKSYVVGGERRRVLVHLDPSRLASRGIAALDVERALAAADANLAAGTLDRGGREVLLEAGPSFRTPDEVGATVVGVVEGRPIFLRDVAEVLDGPEEPQTYTRIGELPAVTIAISKRKGTNAVRVAEDVLERLRAQPMGDVQVRVTRNYGETADHKVNELVKHLMIAIATILVLLAIALGPREALVVAIAVPVTLGVTLLFDLLFGYTINRVTLFALILSLGLLVDDPIVDVENIFRHFQMGKEPRLEATLTAVDEVRPPTILATFTVIVSFLPMFFITGMMGPYMAPMAFNVPIAMLLSLVVAFTITPWAAYHLLKGRAHAKSMDLTKAYGAVIRPALARPWLLLGIVAVLLAGSGILAVTAVPMKMLPFDNKNELAVVIDLPEGTTLEETDAAAREIGRYLGGVSEVSDYSIYVGISAPMDFNGMVRHYYLRRGGNVAEIRVNLLPKERRVQGSHEIAMRIRPDVRKIAAKHGANVKIVEMPPGPPVLSTLVAEIYGPPEATHDQLIAESKRMRAAMEKTEGVVDVDDMAEEHHGKIHYRLDRTKAALAGVNAREVAETLRLAVAGTSPAAVHIPEERLPLEVVVRLPRANRSVEDLLAMRVRTSSGALVPLGEIGTAREVAGERTIHHKNLRRVAFVTAEMSGRSPVEAVLDLRDVPVSPGYEVDWAGEGEWKITLEVFRDLGLAFAAALLMIYFLLVVQTKSLTMPLVIMIAIPLTIIGIMPGFWILNAVSSNLVFFTATGMIGMIALAGIVVRNSIILLDFMERRRAETGLVEAIIEAGATRLRPIFLTAGAAMFGSIVITLDPIFSGLAWSFIFGIFASTAFTLVVVPVVYYLIHRRTA